MKKGLNPNNAILRFLNGIERLGNKLPHPVVLFLALCGGIIVVSHIFYLLGTYVTYEAMNTETYTVETVEARVNSLLAADGIRFMFTSAVGNFSNFRALAVTLIAMVGVGLAESVGLIEALIHRLMKVIPKKSLTFIVVFLGVLSSVATHAGYLVLVPLGAAVFYKAGRHPLAGLAAAFAGVAAGFGVNIFITPNDGMLTEIVNESIHMINPNHSIDLTANLYFSIVSTFFVAIVCTLVTDKIVEPRLGVYKGQVEEEFTSETGMSSEQEIKGLRYALWGFLGTVGFLAALTLPENAPLRHPETSAIIGNSPFMSGLIVIIMLLFLIPGICFGIGSSKIKSSLDVIDPITKVFQGLSGWIFLLLIVSQFIAYFGYTNLGIVIAVNLSAFLQNLQIGTLPLLVMYIIIVWIIDLVLVGVIPKFAILAPVFVPLFMKLGIAPEAMLAAYRVGDSPMNAISPLMPYLTVIVLFAGKYDKKIGLGTMISMMIPYTIIVLISWIGLFIAWYLLNIPLGPGSFILL